MKRNAFCLVVAMAIWSLAWSTDSKPQRIEGSADAQTVEARSKALIKAELDADADAFNTFLSDDYVLLYVEHAAPGQKAKWATMTKQGWAKDIRTGRIRYRAVELRNTKVYLHADIAILAGEYSERGTEDGKDYEEMGLFTETWARRHGEWIMVAGVFP